jgi:hypothetical protein
MGLLKLLPVITGLFKGKTPDVGEQIAKTGKKLFGGGAATGSVFMYLLENPETLESFMAIDPFLGKAVVYGAIVVYALSSLSGLFMYAVGRSQTEKENE